jgi:hypothetical protein
VRLEQAERERDELTIRTRELQEPREPTVQPADSLKREEASQDTENAQAGVQPPRRSWWRRFFVDTTVGIMAEAEKQQKLVKLYTMIASGMAAMVAALFTSKLGVAGTLIGTALTAMTINLGSAVLSAQLAKKPPPRAPPCRSTCETVSLPRRFASPARRARSQTRSRLRGLLTGAVSGDVCSRAYSLYRTT